MDAGPPPKRYNLPPYGDGTSDNEENSSLYNPITLEFGASDEIASSITDYAKPNSEAI